MGEKQNTASLLAQKENLNIHQKVFNKHLLYIVLGTGDKNINRI